MKTLVHERMSDLPPEDRPRERLAARGVTALSDMELLSLMLGSGSGRKGVGRLALDLLSVLDGSGDIPDIGELTVVEGIGPARAAMVAASLEFARRRLRPARRRISEPIDVLPLVTHWSDRPQEHFLVLSLNGAHEVLRLRVVSRGILDRTIVHPREVFVDPLSDRAAAIVCAHNHPSGNIEPSPEDRELTRRLKESGELLGIPLLDHVIFTENGYFSFLESGSL
jgi:DNA repair protein RadC